MWASRSPISKPRWRFFATRSAWRSNIRRCSVTARSSAVSRDRPLVARAVAGNVARIADCEVRRDDVGLACITSRLRVDDIVAALEQLRQRHVRLIDDEPRSGAEGARVAFIHPSSAHGVLVELKQAAADRFKPNGQRRSPRRHRDRHGVGRLFLPGRRRDVRRDSQTVLGDEGASR